MATIAKIERAKPTIVSVQRNRTEIPNQLDTGVLSGVEKSLLPLEQGALFGGAEEANAAFDATTQYLGNKLAKAVTGKADIIPAESSYNTTGEAREATWSDYYNRNLNRERRLLAEAREERPLLSAVSEIGGAVLPSIATFGVAAPASGTSLGIGRGIVAGIPSGALYGFASGEGPENRLENSLISGLIGGGVGGAAPLTIAGLSGAGRIASRVSKGLPKRALPASQVEDFILNSGVLQNTPEQSVSADILRAASAKGARDIYDPLYNMGATLSASSRLRNPNILTNTMEETTPAQTIINAARTPQLEQASQQYANFVASVKDTPGQGLVANQFLKRNPVAAKILSVEPSLKGVTKGSFEWWQNAERTLNNSLPQSLDTSRAIGRRASILNSIDDMSKIREIIHPGTTEANRAYAVGKAWQEEGNKVASERLRFMANMPTENAPALSSKEFLGLFYAPYLRGRARELIQTGGLRTAPEPRSLWNLLPESLGLSISNYIQGNK